jgi:hypothetical protein
MKTQVDFNYRIQNDGINSCSIKYDQEHPENFSKCMKYLLTILKFYMNGALKKEDDEYKEILDKASIIYNNK